MAKQLVRLCDICRRPCTYVGATGKDKPMASHEPPHRWACPDHGGRPSPVLVRR